MYASSDKQPSARAVRKLVYLHGFNSSPNANKAQLLQQKMIALGLSEDFVAPYLPPQPAVAMAKMSEWITAHSAQLITFVGSSLGGFYATYLCEKYANCNSILINPAIRPWELLTQYLGKHINSHTQEEFFVTAEHATDLQRYSIDKIQQPNKYLVLLQTGDTTLNYLHALEHYSAERCLIFPGGSHEFSNFEDVLDRIIKFSGILEDEQI